MGFWLRTLAYNQGAASDGFILSGFFSIRVAAIPLSQIVDFTVNPPLL